MPGYTPYVYPAPASEGAHGCGRSQRSSERLQRRRVPQIIFDLQRRNASNSELVC